jgi:RNA polymerase sigma-70 factor (ECF subfamily)
MRWRQDLTCLLDAVGRGDDRAEEALLEVVYEELREIARAFMARERPDHTLQPTAVVHEAYLRLFEGGPPGWESRAHFFGTAARAMRRILVDHARCKVSSKRGGDRRRVELVEVPEAEGPHPEDVLSLDRALDRLEERDTTMARVVELRYFGGLSVKETARVLETSPRSVNRAWTAARAWLSRELDRTRRAGRGDL